MEAAPRKRRLMGEINVVPLIDVMLVLLIIFMATAPLLTQGVQVDLPHAAAKPLPPSQREPALVISIDRQARMFLNTGRTPDKALDEAALEAGVVRALTAAPQRDVLIQADTAVPYGRVMSAMVILQRAGATKIGFLAAPLPEAGGRRP